MGITVDALVCVIIGGLMSLCCGFGSYGCYRCCTDFDGEGKVHSECSSSSSLSSKYKVRRSLNLFGLRKKSLPKVATCKSVRSRDSLSSFNGTIYTVSSPRGSWIIEDGKIPYDVLRALEKNPDYALGIHPGMLDWSLKPNNNNNNNIKMPPLQERGTTAPI